MVPVVSELNRRLAQHVSRESGPENVFLARKPWRWAHLVTASEIEAVAHEHGFTVVYPEELTFIEQVNLLANAKRVVAPEGSALFLCYFASPGTKLLSSGQRESSRASTCGACSSRHCELVAMSGTIVDRGRALPAPVELPHRPPALPRRPQGMAVSEQPTQEAFERQRHPRDIRRRRCGSRARRGAATGPSRRARRYGKSRLRLLSRPLPAHDQLPLGSGAARAAPAGRPGAGRRRRRQPSTDRSVASRHLGRLGSTRARRYERCRSRRTGTNGASSTTRSSTLASVHTTATYASMCRPSCTTAIYSVSVLAHMTRPEREETVDLVSRWLEPGGRLLLAVDLLPKSDFLWNRSEGVEVESPTRARHRRRPLQVGRTRGPARHGEEDPSHRLRITDGPAVSGGGQTRLSRQRAHDCTTGRRCI